MKHIVAHVGDIAGDFFRSELGVAGGHFEFFDVDGRIDVVAHGTFGDEDGVFVVIAAPGHEGHDEVLAKGKFAVLDAGAVGKHVVLLHALAGVAGGLLAEAGVLVRLVVLQKIVAAHTAAIFDVQVVIGHDDAFGVGIAHHAVAFGKKAGAGVAGHIVFHARTDEGTFGTQERNGLTLHVRAHEGAVGVVVFEEGNQRGGDGDHLAGRDILQGDFIAGSHEHVAAGGAHGHVFFGEAAFSIDRGVGLSNDLVLFTGGVEMHDLFGLAAFAHHAIGGLDEAVLVHLGVGGQRNDKADVRTFRRFDGADTAVVGGMNVAHFEAGAFTGKTAGAQSGKTTLVGHFRQGVGLVHELGKLGRAEEFLQHGGHRLGIDEVVGHQGGDFLNAHAFLDGAFHAHEADAVLVFHQFAHQTHAAVAQMVDIIGSAVGVLHGHEDLDGRDDVFVGEGQQILVGAEAEAQVQLVAAHGGQVVVVAVAEQVVEVAGRDLGRGRRAGTQAAVDLFLSLLGARGLVEHEGVAHGRRGVGALGVQHDHIGHTGFQHLFHEGSGHFVGGFGDDLAGGGVHHVFTKEEADKGVGGDFDGFDIGRSHLAPVALVHLLAGLDHHVAFGVEDVGKGDAVLIVAEKIGIGLQEEAVAVEAIVFLLVEGIEDIALGHAHSLEQDGGRHLAATVDTYIEDVLMVEVEVEPGTAHGDDAAGVEHLAGGVGLAAVVFEDDARGTLELVHDDAFGAVHDERALLGHQGQSAEIDVLFLAVTIGTRAGSLVHVVDVETNLDAHGSFVGQALGDTLGLIVLGLADFVAQIFQAGGAVEIFDGEDGTEHAFEAGVGITFRILASFLKEGVIRVHLKIQKVRNGNGYFDFAELLRKLTHYFTSEWHLSGPLPEY